MCVSFPSALMISPGPAIVQFPFPDEKVHKGHGISQGHTKVTFLVGVDLEPPASSAVLLAIRLHWALRSEAENWCSALE